VRRSPLLTTVVGLFACLAAPSFVYAQAEFSVVHSFTRTSAPFNPGGLIEGTDGNFYGRCDEIPVDTVLSLASTRISP